MPPRRRFFAKIEADPSQRKITHYFPKSDKWKHDFTIAKPTRKASKRFLVPEIVATIDLNSSDDEFQASNFNKITAKPKKAKAKPTTKERKTRRKRSKTQQSGYREEAEDTETNIDDTVNCPESLETYLEPEILLNTSIDDGENVQTNINDAVNSPEFMETYLEPEILLNTSIDDVENATACTSSNGRESDYLNIRNTGTGISYSNEAPYKTLTSRINNLSPDRPVANILLPKLYQVSENTLTDSVCINKSKILTNCPEKSKSVILQRDTINLFTVDDEIEESQNHISNTNIPSPKVYDQMEDQTIDVILENNERTDIYLECFASSNKENSPEICNTLIPHAASSSVCDNLLKSPTLSAPMENSIDITIASFEPEETNAMDNTLIRDYVNRNDNENIHDVLVELHNALDRMENTEAIDTDSPYYKMFFLRKVIRNVVENFDMLRLLRDAERRTLVKFLQMDTKYQYFCYRLFTRLPKWYNMYKLMDYIKLDMSQKDSADMYSCLQENNFIQTDYSKESISTLLHLLERTALTRIHSKFKIKSSKYNTKEVIIETLITFCNSQTTLSANFRPDQILYKLISIEMGPCAKLDNNFYTTLSRVHLLNSFTNSELTKISDLYFFMSQIAKGEVVLPSYDVESAIGNVFPKRQDFLLYSKAAEYKYQFILKMEKTGKDRDWKSIKDICDYSYLELQNYIHNNNTFHNNSDLMNRFTAAYKYASILSEASKHLTKMYSVDVEKWLFLLIQQRDFCQKRRGLWYDRLALIKSTYQKEVDKAAEIILMALDDPFVSESGRREILNRGINLMRRKTNKVRDNLKDALKLKIPNSLEKAYSVRNIQGKQQPGKQGKCYYLDNDGEHHTYYTVEEYSIKHYITEVNFTDGVHCEGALFTTLFTVLFWDIIYDEYTAGTFLNNLQVYPLDYFSKDFYTNRENAIDGRLEQITRVWSDECFERAIRDNFEQHKNKRCGIASSLFESGEQLVTIARCIGRQALAVVMMRLVQHIGDMCAGLPDLFVWNSVTNKCKFVEVKSEKDTLSMKQILWLNFLISANLDAEVCHVLPSINASNVPASKRATVE